MFPNAMFKIIHLHSNPAQFHDFCNGWKFNKNCYLLYDIQFVFIMDVKNEETKEWSLHVRSSNKKCHSYTNSYVNTFLCLKDVRRKLW